MAVIVDLQIADDGDDQPPPSSIEHWVATAIECAQQHDNQHARSDDADFELTVRIVEPAEITELNHLYRHKNTATNVLSFPAELPDHIELPLLGDLIICVDVVRQEAIEQHKSLLDHWAHMLVHGTLHLLGYDHIEDDEAEVMEALEITVLAKLGVANPYLEISPPLS